jgi:hypothetical protein
MKYSFIINAADEKTIGKTYPQCKGVPEGYTHGWYKQPNSMTKLNNKYFPENNPDLLFELKNDAKFTDIVSVGNISAKGFLINQKVKDILDDFNLIEHKYYPAKLIVNRKAYDYYWLHIVKDNLLGINFKKSNFIEINITGKKINDIEINSMESFLLYKKSLTNFNRIDIEKLTLQDNYKLLDLFFFPNIFMNRIICSERIADAFRTNHITGYELKKINM